MFLATTADQRLWKKDARTLFLGQWCLLYSEREAWERLDYEVLPYPFDDRERLYQSYVYLQPVYERALRRVATVLDQAHRCHHDLRFWEILAGYWLREFMEILFERYICLREACASGVVRSTKVMSCSSYLIPRDSHHFAALYQGDFYNAQLYSQIIQNMQPRGVDIEEVPLEERLNDHQVRTVRKRLTTWLRERIAGVSLAASRHSRFFLVSTYFPWRALVKLSLSCRSFPLLDTPRVRVPSGGRVDRGLRDRLRPCGEGDEFERLLYDTMADNLPRIYLEEYQAAGAIVETRFPRSVRLVATANAFAYNDLFKRWAATQVENGVPLVILQHGGSYGCGRWNSSEDYETRVADWYYTYGWNDKTKQNVIPWSASRLRLRIPRSTRARRNGYILWAAVSFPRYSYSMYAVPAGPQVLAYLDYQQRFLRAVSEEVRALLVYRPYPLRYGWSDEERLQDAGGGVRIARVTERMRRQLKRSRLFVGTFNATSFLETFVAQIPTVLFWDPKLWELRPEAQLYFERLRSASILHDTPESAARFIGRIYGAPEEWWQRPEVQHAVSLFCDRYARAWDKSLRDWQEEFERVAGAPVNQCGLASPQASPP